MLQSLSIQHIALSIAIAASAVLSGCPEPIAAGTSAASAAADGEHADGGGFDGAQAVEGEPAEVVIPAGPFWMGCSPLDTSCAAKGSPEKPQHQVVLAKYAIDVAETTVADYAKCAAAGACTKPPDASHPTEPFNFGVVGREMHPINGVNWSQALAYCQWRGKRLPSEAEWEKAARGGCEAHKGDCGSTALVYPWGNQPPDCTLAQFTPGKPPGCSGGMTAPVGSLPAGRSPYGLWDTAGNVWEWTADWYDENFYSVSPVQDPQGPPTGEVRTRRGGGYPNEAGSMRLVRRYGLSAEVASPDTGFRCARSL